MPQKRTVPLTCQNCGVTYLAMPRDAAIGRSKYCSRQCCGAAGGRVMQRNNPQQGERNNNFKGWRTRQKAPYYKSQKVKHFDRWKARAEVNKAVARGDLKRPRCCEACGIERFTQAHHEDYSRPLDVTWLCVPCHRAQHRGRATGADRPAPHSPAASASL